MSLQKTFPALKNEYGKSIKCSHSGCRRVARHTHHIIPRCEGGSDDNDNTIALCQKCHIAHHSQRGDFAHWGRLSGLMQKEHLTFLFTLKQFKSSPQKRLIYVSEKMPEKLGVLASLEMCYGSYEYV